MEQNAANTNDDGLFGGVNIEDLEKHLITVDVPEDDKRLEEELQDTGEPGGGEPGDGGEQDGGGKPPEDKTPPPDKLITVDISEEEVGPEDKTEKPAIADDEKKGGSTPAESDSPVYLHAAALQENGVLPNFDLTTLKDLKPDEAITEINKHIQSQINESINEGIEEYKSNIGERAVNFIKSLEDGIPFEDLAENYTLEERFGNITEKDLQDDEDMQESIYADYLALKGFSDQKIKKMVETAKEKEELFSEAKEGLSEINQAIKEERSQLEKDAKKRKDDNEKRNNEIKEKINTTVNSVEEILPGLKVTNEEKKELIKMMTVPVKYIDNNGRKIPVSRSMELRAEDPIAYELRLNYLISKGFFDKDLKNIKLNTFMKKSETSAAKKLVDSLSKEDKSKPVKTVEQEKKEKEKDSFQFPQDITIK